MVATLRQKFAGFKDANILVVNPPAVKGLGSAGGFKMMLEDRSELGPQALADATNKLVAAARKDPTFAAVYTLYNAGSPSVYADIDREKAEKVGLSTADIFPTLELYMGSQYVNDFNLLGRTYPVFVQGDQQFRQSPAEIARLKVRNATGEMVPIGTVATFKDQTTPYRSPRYNLYPASEVMGEPCSGCFFGGGAQSYRRARQGDTSSRNYFRVDGPRVPAGQEGHSNGCYLWSLCSLRVPGAHCAVRELEDSPGNCADCTEVSARGNDRSSHQNYAHRHPRANWICGAAWIGRQKRDSDR